MIPDLPESPDDQVALIHRETRRLDQLIEQIKREKAALLRKLNATQSPAIAIPAEILSHILELASPWPGFQEHKNHSFPPNTHIPRFQYFQFRFSKVSSYWRQVVWSTPRLWSCISLHIPARSAEETEGVQGSTDMNTVETGTSTAELNTNLGKRAMFLRLFIENSKGVPLKIALSFSTSIDPRSPHLVHEFVDNFLIGASRIKELHITSPPYRWLDYTSNLNQLQDFSVGTYPPGRPMGGGQITFPSNTPLRRLSLQTTPWVSAGSSQPPWTTLTLLELSFIPSDLSVQAFIRCPNLVSFSCYSPPRRQSPSEGVTLTSPVQFQHLTNFRWETDDNTWSRALIQYLHVPALKEMYWTTFGAKSENHDDVRGFFNRLPPTLRKLTLDATTSNLQYINDDSQIETLVLDACRVRHLRTLFRRLKPSQQGHVKPFPQLKEVSLYGELVDDNTMTHVSALPSSYSTMLVEALEQRLDGSNRTFTLEMEATKFDWEFEAQRKLRRLARSGCTVKIVENFSGD